MNEWDLMKSLGSLDEDLIDRSEKPRRIRIPWGTLAAAAACLVLVVGVFMPTFFAGKSAEAETRDYELARLEPAAENDCAVPEYLTEEPGAPESVTGDAGTAHGLIYNDPALCNPIYWEPLPGEITRVSLDAQTLGCLSPVEDVRAGEAIYYEDGRLLRVNLEVPVAGTDTVIRLAVADLYPNYQVDDPGEGIVSVIGDTQCLATEIPIRAPRGTGWKLEVILQSHGLNYDLTVTAAPEENDSVREALEELIAAIDSAAAPDLGCIPAP